MALQALTRKQQNKAFRSGDEPNDANTVTRANKLFFLFALAFFVTQVSLRSALLSYVQRFGMNVAMDLFFDLSYLFILYNEVVLILMPAIIYAVFFRLDLRSCFRIRAVSWKILLLVVLISVPLYIVMNSANAVGIFFLQHIIDVSAAAIPIPTTLSDSILALMIIAVMPAVCEEFLIRGIMLDAYMKRGAVSAITASAFFFALFHFDITNFFAPLIFGLVIGYVVVKTSSIFPAILAHFLNNAYAQLLQIFFPDPSATGIVTIDRADLWGIVLTGLISLIAMLVLLFIFSNKEGGIEMKKNIRPPIKGALDILTHWPVTITLVIYGVFAYLRITR